MKIIDSIEGLDVLCNNRFQTSSQFIFIEGINDQLIVSLIDLIKYFLPKTDKTITLQLKNYDYRRFSAFETLVRKLLPLNLKGNRDLFKRYEKYLSKIIPELYRKNTTYNLNIADSIVLAVVRRISRESHHSAILIDYAAHFLIEVLEKTLSRNNNINILLPDFDFWDRPSLRIINRINKLNQTVNIKWIAFTNYDKHLPDTKSDDFATKIINSHFTFLDKFKQIQPGLKRFRFGHSKNFDLSKISLNTGDVSINEMAIDLAFQNYERVYHIARLAKDKIHQSEDKSQVLRLIALTDASRGDYKEAYKQLEKAFELTKLNSFKAHLKYLQGLIYTKRFYDLEVANKHYDNGLKLIRNVIGENRSVYAGEKAWLLNGKALVHALKAKGMSQEGKRKEILKSFNLEIDAYSLVKKGNSPNLAYLRYNLLANITFLLEIDKKYNEAIGFWSKAFERYLTKNNPAFELAFKTRLGLLQHKAGKNSQAIESLKEAYQICSQLKDPFYQERITYAYAYVLFNCKNYKEAAKYFFQGVRITNEIKEWDDFAEHLKGLRLAAIMSKNKQLIKKVRELSVLNKNINYYLNAVDIKLREPEPKLSSYIPSIDLEGTPERDLNRYLVSTKSYEDG